MRQTVVAAMLCILGAGGALAADLEVPRPAPIPPSSYYPQAVNWSGMYFGINGGYALGVSDWGDAGVSTGNFNTKGGLVGATLGINYADGLAGLLIGVEGDFDWSWLNGSSSVAACTGLGVGVPAGSACATKSNWLSTGRGRAGYVFRNFLFFGTAGVATSDFMVGLQPGVLQSVTGPQLGWTAGGGIEYAFADYLTAKLEYLFVDFGTVSCPANTGCGTLNTASVTRSESVIRGGLNYKITW